MGTGLVGDFGCSSKVQMTGFWGASWIWGGGWVGVGLACSYMAFLTTLILLRSSPHYLKTSC